MAWVAPAVAPPPVTVRRTGCPQAPELLTVTSSVPWDCWPADSAARVHVAPPLAGWQLQPPASGRAVPSNEPLSCWLPPDEALNTELPAGSAITAVSGPDAAEPVLVTWNTSVSGCPDEPRR